MDTLRNAESSEVVDIAMSLVGTDELEMEPRGGLGGGGLGGGGLRGGGWVLRVYFAAWNF